MLYFSVFSVVDRAVIYHHYSLILLNIHEDFLYDQQ